MTLKTRSIVTALSLLILCPILFLSAEANNNKIEDEFVEGELKSLEKQEDAYLSYKKLMNLFDKTKSEDLVYPDYYGGSYTNDNGELVIYIHDDKGLKDDSYQDINNVIEAENYITKTAKYSYNELNAVMDVLNNYKLINPDDAISNNFNFFMVSDIDNNVTVELDEMTVEQIALFKKHVIDSPIIKFISSRGAVVDHANINPGDSVSKGSMGYRAKKDGVIGIVTAGHVVPMGADVTFDSDGNTIGVVTAWQESGPVDAAFVEITDSSYKHLLIY